MSYFLEPRANKSKKKLNKIYPIMKKNLTQKAQETLIYCNLLEKMT